MNPKTQSTHEEKIKQGLIFKINDDSGGDTLNLDYSFCSDHFLVMLQLKVNKIVKRKRILKVQYSITLCSVKINNFMKILWRQKSAPYISLFNEILRNKEDLILITMQLNNSKCIKMVLICKKKKSIINYFHETISTCTYLIKYCKALYVHI